MPLDLDDVKRPKKRWLPMDGHLSGVDLLVQFIGTQETQRFRNRLEGDGIITVTKDNPLKINAGRDKAFFREVTVRYVLDWRGDIKPEGAAYDAEKMADVLCAYPRAFELLMQAVADENSFFAPEQGGLMSS